MVLNNYQNYYDYIVMISRRERKEGKIDDIR